MRRAAVAALASAKPPAEPGSAAQAGWVKLIVVGNLPGRLNTIYRVRALLATMTSVARTLPIFRQHGVEDDFTFLDLMKMLGFESVTVSDGDSFTHQIILR